VKNRLPSLLSAALAFVFVLVVWGGVVRLSGSGLAIPDWPLAEGKLIPRAHPNVLIEYTHRAIAGIVGILTLWICVTVFRSARWRSRLGALTVAALITLALQIFMGARVVLDELPVDRVVAHLLLAFLFFGILLRMALLARDPELDGVGGSSPTDAGTASGAHRGLARWAAIAATAVFAQAGLGAWVSSSGAALACPDFPTCHGQWLPKLEGLIGIQFTHRLGAYLVSLIILGLLFRAAPRPLPPRARWPLRISGILLAMQFTLGVMNVLLHVPLPVSAGHLGTALVLYGTLIVASHELSRA
jgi:cytochrome c oxidase assembly protein subunit 15